jgi:hypothetical protein
MDEEKRKMEEGMKEEMEQARLAMVCNMFDMHLASPSCDCDNSFGANSQESLGR